MRRHGWAVIAVALVLGGCGGIAQHMVVSTRTEYTPAPSKALVIFLRPSGYLGAIQTSVLDLGAAGRDATLVGTVTQYTKVAHQAAPGDHLFMVYSARGAGFAAAHLLAGRTYYLLVEPSYGVWGTHFGLQPIRAGAGKYGLQGDQFPTWLSQTAFVELAPSASEWFQEDGAGAGAVEARDRYLPKWLNGDPAQRAEHTVNAEDGV